MKIELDTSTASAGELTALIALLASLGGRLPEETYPLDTPSDPRFPTGVVEERTFVGMIPTIADVRRSEGEQTAESLPSERLMDAAVAAAQPAGDPNEVDAEGIPWDERIHSGNRAKNADGTWRKRRGVDEVTYGRIYGELQERAAALGEPETSGTTGTPSDGTAPTPSDTAPTPSAPPPPATPAAPPPATPAAPPPPPADTGNVQAAASAPTAGAPPAPDNVASAPADGARFATFPEFVQGVNAIRNPAIPYLELNTYAETLGVSGGFKNMKDHAPLWDDFYALAGGQ